MRSIVVIFLVLFVGAACAPSRARIRNADAPIIGIDLEDKFAKVRPAIDELASAGHEQARVHFNTWSDRHIEGLVDLAPTRFGNGVDVLVIVRVRTTGTSVGKELVMTNAELRKAGDQAAARPGNVVALVRVSDDTMALEAFGILQTLKRSRFAAVVLASTQPDMPLATSDASDPAGRCMFPEGATRMREAARVEIEVDADGLVTAVTVEESLGPAHAYAAAMCAARRALTREDYTFDPREARGPRFRDDTPVMKTPRDVRQ